jgi:hypothetical protein
VAARVGPRDQGPAWFGSGVGGSSNLTGFPDSPRLLGSQMRDLRRGRRTSHPVYCEDPGCYAGRSVRRRRPCPAKIAHGELSITVRVDVPRADPRPLAADATVTGLSYSALRSRQPVNLTRPATIPVPLGVVSGLALVMMVLRRDGWRGPGRVREGCSLESHPLLVAFRRTPGNSRTKATGHRRPPDATTLPSKNATPGPRRPPNPPRNATHVPGKPRPDPGGHSTRPAKKATTTAPFSCATANNAR